MNSLALVILNRYSLPLNLGVFHCHKFLELVEMSPIGIHEFQLVVMQDGVYPIVQVLGQATYFSNQLLYLSYVVLL